MTVGGGAAHERARPWDTDRELDDDLAAAVVAELFPDLAGPPLEWVGAGWDFDVYRTGPWAVRFPRRAAYGRRAWEGPLLRLVGPRLAEFDVQVPVPLREARAPELFPYHVTVHRWVPGRDAGTLPRGAALDMLPMLGRCLRRIHETPPDACRTLGLPTEDWLMHQRMEETQGDLPELERLVDFGADAELEAHVAWVAGLTRADVPAEPDGPLPLIHNDLGTEHVLADPASGRLTGLIDWTDAGYGDPANDFVGIFASWGRAGLDRAFEGYGAVDPGLRARVEFMARVSTLHWLHNARVRGEDGRKQRRWMRNAFADVAAP